MQLDPQQFQHPTGSEVAVVVPAKVAGVVVGGHDLLFPVRLQVAPLQKLDQELGVVKYWVIAAQPWVLLADRVEAVGVGGHDALELAPLEGLDVVLGQHLEEALLPHPADVVAAVALTLVEDSEVDPSSGHDPGDAPREPLHPGIVGGEVTHEPEHIDRLLARVLDREAELPGPPGPQPLRLVEGVAVPGQAGQGVLQLVFHPALFDQLSAHVDDLGDVLDVERTDLHAGTAGGAGP